MFVKIFNDECKKVTYYSICEDDENDMVETEKFLRKMKGSDYEKETYELLNYMFNLIGNKYGLHKRYFTRLEREAYAFPPKKNKNLKKETIYYLLNSRVRLYVYKVSDSICILFNGGIKLTDGSAQDDPDVSMPFRMANVYSKKIRESLADGTICVKGKYMVLCDTEEKEFYI